mmetsp:Transcript_14349/g.16996  ORF Transcript_14349/g.16996 Transcript_14349/m.16996 type:complete len:214 (+) Transcript_14349:141-782(+)
MVIMISTYSQSTSSDIADENDSRQVDAELIYIPQHEMCVLTTKETVPELVADDIDEGSCDACPFCPDVCINPACNPCSRKTDLMQKRQLEWKQASSSLPPFRLFGSFSTFEDKGEVYVTRCQARRHNHMNSAWLRCGEGIYDATEHIRRHPGGERSILRKSGGDVDCTIDMAFHSSRSVKLWKQCRIATLRQCPGEKGFCSESHEKAEPCVIS